MDKKEYRSLMIIRIVFKILYVIPFIPISLFFSDFWIKFFSYNMILRLILKI